jgi:hypothetical protein
MSKLENIKEEIIKLLKNYQIVRKIGEGSFA